MIVHEKDKWVLKTKDGSKTLGTHASKEEAEAQERAVEAHKHSDCKDCGMPDARHIHKDCVMCQDAEALGIHGVHKGEHTLQPSAVGNGVQHDAKSYLHLDSGMPVGRMGAEVLANGWLKAPAFLTRTGVFTYHRADGTEVKQLRLPEEVFAPSTLKSFEMVPVTDDHPFSPLNAETTKLHQIGQVGEKLIQDGKFVKANVMITDSRAVKQILDGDKVELSCGYFAEDDCTPGQYNGEHYDSIQRNIRGNHVALLRPGQSRGGPELKLRLDSAAQNVVTIEIPPKHKGKTFMANFKIDGVDFEVSEQAAQALSKQAKASDAALTEAKAEAAKASAKADSLASDLKKSNEALTSATDPKALQATIKARVALEATAAKVCGDDFKSDALTDLEVKVAVVEKITGEKLKRTDAAYVDAAFDLASSKASPLAKHDSINVRADLVAASQSKLVDAAASRKAMIEDLEKSSKRTPGAKS